VFKKTRPVLLALACLALGALVFLDNRPAFDEKPQPSVRTELQSPNPTEHDGPAQNAIEPNSVGLELSNPLADFDKAGLSDWIERPLFAPSRQRPATIAKTALPRQTAPKQPPPSYDLLGIVRNGERAIALLRKKGEGTSFRVEVGDMVGGWSIAKVESASVVLKRADGTSQTVTLSTPE